MTDKDNTITAEEGKTGVDLTDVFYLCLSRWYWFLISILLFLGLGMWVIVRTPPVYHRYASVLIKDNQSHRNTSIDQQLAQIGVGKSSNVNNEMLAFQSPALTENVVRRLKLDVDYTVSGFFHDETLYGKTLPIQVQFLSLTDERSARLDISYERDGHFQMTNFSCNFNRSIDRKQIVKGRFGQIVNTPIGRVRVTPTSNFEFEINSQSIHVVRSTIAKTIEHYNKVEITLADKNAEILNMAFNDVSQERAENVLSMLIDAYNDSWLADKNQIAVNTSKFINERLQVIENELGNVDKNISSYKSVNLLSDTNEASTLYMKKTEENTDKMMELNNQIYMTQYVNQLILNEKKKYDLLPVNSGINSTAIETMIGDYNSSVLQRNRLVMNSSASSPLIADLEERILKQRQAIAVSVNNWLLTLQNQAKSLTIQESALTSKLAKAPNQASYLQSISREQKVKESLYIFLLQKREENQLSIAFTAYNTRIITPPTGSHKPIAPIKRNILLIALGLAIALPFAIFYLREMFDTRVRGRKDMENLDIPHIGEIPHMDPSVETWTSKLLVKLGLKKLPQRLDKSEVVVKPQSANVINEAFRVLRSNFEFCTNKFGKGVVTMVVSANPNSGKTFVTMNLAMSMVIKNKKAVVVDLDFRKAATSLFVGRPKYGISNYLNGQGTLDDIVCKYRDTNLDVIPVGIMPPNPTELLYDERMNQLFSELKERYDYIFLDCPPVEIVADAAIISRHADLSLFVIRAHLLERSMLPEINDFYRTNRYPNMVTVLNGTLDTYKSYGYHRYGYRYGYRYGFGIDYGKS